MRLLLDTHIALWVFGAPEKLSKEVLRAVNAPGSELWLSVASLWEIAIKAQAGKIQTTSSDILYATERANLSILPIYVEHAVAVEKLPRLHGDPFDRMLIAQAQVEGLRIVTADYTFDQYGINPLFT